MNSTLRSHAIAFGLATFFTLSLMASINQLATAPAPAQGLAQIDSAPVQMVGVTAKRSQG
jgi:hypothetical protein